MPSSSLGEKTLLSVLSCKLVGIWQRVVSNLHLLVIVPTVLVLGSSPFLLMGRKLRDNANIWELTHVYLGLLLVPLSLMLLFYCLSGGRAAQFFPFGQTSLLNDIKGLFKGKFPTAGGAGLFSLLEGMCALLLCLAALSGLGWYLAEGSREALSWRAWHKDISMSFFIVVIIHMVAALSHVLAFFRK